jgi:2,3-dihydroxyphenylpropionate 1,2-dioxygenase
MAGIVVGVGASHSTLMNTHWDRVEHKDRAERFRDGLYAARRSIAAARPDVALIVGSNHFRGFWLDLLPAFTLGVGEVTGSGESGTPGGPLPADPEFARHLANTLVERDGFDLAYSARLQIDHGQTHAVQYLLSGLDIPIVPLVVNVFAPPLPTLRRCQDLGRAIRAAIGSFPGARRVAVIGSGGLSHVLPWPDWRDPKSDDDEFMVQAWTDGRNHWQDYDARRRQIILTSPSVIAESFDEEFLSWLEKGEAGQLANWTTARLQEAGGNGAQEIRTWLIMAAALGHAPATRIAYEVLPEWLTGMGVVSIEP